MRDQERSMFRTSNPAMNEGVFEHPVMESADPMTLAGTIQKTGFLLLMLLATAGAGWMFPSYAGLIGGVIVAIILGFVIGFKAHLAPVLAPAYALVEGYVVGVISFIAASSLAKTAYAGAVPIAVAGTMVTLAVMLTLYATRIIRVTETMRSVIIGLTAAVALLYLFSFVVGLFAPAFVSAFPIYQSGLIGIVFSVIVIGIAAFNFLLDFDLIERGVGNRAPKYMEWYAGFGLLVTMVWLYIEILRLLMKLANNR
ncbi:MAG: Bax inhibitor-1/YccA family protein [Chthonomonas sp.]|nr:Bax inhibitor-1/YccA family protein [Chthonomonas sp.]